MGWYALQQACKDASKTGGAAWPLACMRSSPASLSVYLQRARGSRHMSGMWA